MQLAVSVFFLMDEVHFVLVQGQLKLYQNVENKMYKSFLLEISK